MDEETKDVTKNEEVQEEQAKEVIQKKPEEQLDGELKADEKYSIYHFITENSSILGMVGSVCIAIVAACLRLASYLHHLAYLRYWNIDTSLVAEPENYWLEKTGLSLLMFVSGTLYMFWIIHLLEKKKKRVSILKNYRNAKKENLKRKEKSFNDKENEIQSLKRAQSEHSHDYYTEKKQSLERDLIQIQDRITNLKTGIKEIKKELTKTKLANHVIILFLSLILCGFFILAFLQLFQSILASIIAAIGSIVFILSSAKISVWMDKKDTVSPSFIASCAQENRISNFWIVFFVIIALLGGAAYSIYEYCAGDNAAKTKTSFEITQTHERLCAIIVADSDYLIAEEIQISDDNKSATIYSDSVFIIPKESEPVLEKKSFEKAPIVKAKGEDE